MNGAANPKFETLSARAASMRETKMLRHDVRARLAMLGGSEIAYIAKLLTQKFPDDIDALYERDNADPTAVPMPKNLDDPEAVWKVVMQRQVKLACSGDPRTATAAANFLGRVYKKVADPASATARKPAKGEAVPLTDTEVLERAAEIANRHLDHEPGAATAVDMGLDKTARR